MSALLGIVAAFAGDDVAAPAEVRVVRPAPTPDDPAVRALAIVQTKLVATDVSTTNPFLDGQVFGTLGGTNETTVAPDEIASYTEHRVSAFLTWTPPVLSGRAALTAAFESDFSFGDRSYGIGGNNGGAFGADQVNLQTRRLHATLKPLVGDDPLTVYVGLQFLPDGAWDPTTSRPDDVLRGGGRLLFFGSEASGISAYGQIRDGWGTRLRYRAGWFTLYEKGLGQPDDATLYVADAVLHPEYAVDVGLHAWYLRDRTDGVMGTFGVGPTSALSGMQGGPRMDFRPDGTGTQPDHDVDVGWIGVDVGLDHRLDHGPLGVTGLFVANVGSIRPDGQANLPIRGALGDVEARWRYAKGEGTVVRVEGLASTGDRDSRPYNGVLTGNTWGIVGSLHATHGALLLFPDPFSINRYVSVAHDVSGGGEGLLGASASIGYDPIPDRLNVKAGVATAAIGGDAVGTEVNLRVTGEPLLFLNTGLNAAVVLGTDQPAAPWTVYGSLDWVVF